MEDNRIETNQVYISGKIVSDFQAFFKGDNTSYYMADMAVRRLSRQMDYIPVVLNDQMLNMAYDHKGQYISVIGQYISYNLNENGRRRLKFYVMAEKMELKDVEDRTFDDNYIFLDGYICKEPIYRKTPHGHFITDLFLAVSGSNMKSYYIPCICWGRTAYYAASLSVGGRVEIVGRIQSREYNKQLDAFTVERRIAYEVSVKNFTERMV